jgi:hypothetical protein
MGSVARVAAVALLMGSVGTAISSGPLFMGSVRAVASAALLTG